MIIVDSVEADVREKGMGDEASSASGSKARPLTARALARIADRRVERARTAFAKLTDTERAALFREFSRCACAEIGKVIAKSPSAGLGALVGGFLGAVYGGKK